MKNENQELTGTPLEIAIQAAGGRQYMLAEKLGISPQRLTYLKRSKKGFLPRDKIEDYVRATGLSREILFPDVFCPETRTKNRTQPPAE